MRLLDPHQYQACADATFASVVEELSEKLLGVRFEHVGASSVAGAISKGDLDICIVVAPSSHQWTVEILESLGYAIKADTLRTPDLCMLVSPRQTIDVALQVVSEGSQFDCPLSRREGEIHRARYPRLSHPYDDKVGTHQPESRPHGYAQLPVRKAPA